MSRTSVGWTAGFAALGVLAALLVFMAMKPDSRDVRIGSVYGASDAPVLEVFWGDCATGAPLRVEESREQVVITASIPLPPDASCPDIGRTDRVTLEAALGDREVVDGSTGSSVDVLDPVESS